MPDGRRPPASSKNGLLFPANFNPVHEGHWCACDHAEAETGQQVELMIEACPPNKPAIPIPEILRRVARVQLEGARRSNGPRPVTITFGEATYLEKARAHPGSRFIVGADAALRLLDPIWGHDIAAMLAEFESLETTFLVQRRRIGDRTLGISDMKIPSQFHDLFNPLDGYTEISSSEIRARKNAA